MESMGAPPPAPSPSSIDLLINQAAADQKIDPMILRRLLNRESGGQANPGVGSAGEIGIAQFTPGTAKQFGIDPSDPAQAIPAAAKYIRQNLNQFGGDYDKAVAGYNWGPGNVARQGLAAAPASVKSYVDYVVRGQGGNTAGGNRRPAAVPLAQTIAPAGPAVASVAPPPQVAPQQQVAQQFPMTPPAWLGGGGPLSGQPTSLADAFLQASKLGQTQLT